MGQLDNDLGSSSKYFWAHYGDVIMSGIASQITSLTIVYLTIYSDADQRKHHIRVTGLCAGNSPGTGDFPAQMASNAENVSIWWRNHELQQGSHGCIWGMDTSSIPPYMGDGSQHDRTSSRMGISRYRVGSGDSSNISCYNTYMEFTHLKW